MKLKHIPIPQIVHLRKDLITVGTWGARATASEELELRVALELISAINGNY